MDLNSAMHAAQSGGRVRDDATMAPDWTVRFVSSEGLFYYFDPEGKRAHKIKFSDAQRASFQWRVVP